MSNLDYRLNMYDPRSDIYTSPPDYILAEAKQAILSDLEKLYSPEITLTIDGDEAKVYIDGNLLFTLPTDKPRTLKGTVTTKELRDKVKEYYK